MSRAEYQVRATLILIVATLSIASWFITWYQVRNMGLLMQVGVPMSLGMEGVASVTSFLLFTGMWSVMMVAMMLPSTYPILLLHQTVSRNRTGSTFGTLVFALTYFLTWTASGSAFYYAYTCIGALRASVSNADVLVLRTAGFTLLAAGLYQWSPSKWACLKHCQNPLHFIIEHWSPGLRAAARTGVVHGLYCIGCCWGLMTILFVMGVMHLGWMAGIGAIILLEKLLPTRIWIVKASGAVFVLLGLLVLIRPSVLSALSSQVGLQ